MVRTRSFGAFLASLNAGERVFVGGSSGEPAGFVEALLSDGDRVAPVEFTTTFVPGINSLPIDDLGPSLRFSGPFLQPGWRRAHAEGRYRHLPMSYAGLLKHITEGPLFDAVVLQVSPPDVRGMCSLGPATEFALKAAGRSRRVVAAINPRVRAHPGAAAMALSDFTELVETGGPLATYEAAGDEAQGSAIASHIAPFVGDGAALQVGLGKTPQALLSALKDRRRLRIHSGMLPEGVVGLALAGALDPRWTHTACVAVGSGDLYDWLAGEDAIRIAGCDVTHSPASLARLTGLVAVNGALEVDLFGQANLEIAGARAVSGAGGAPDFAHAAARCLDGLSVVALPATHGATGSRIVVRLGGLATLPRTDVDVVVTEFGAADLRGKSTHERAEALIEVAAPQFRSDLRDAWREIAAGL